MDLLPSCHGQPLRMDVFKLCYKPHKRAQMILSDVTFKALPGQICAILSPDIAERKTLLHVISGRRMYGECTGDILIDGLPQGDRFTQHTAFVPQCPTYMTGLSYRETIDFAVRLRLKMDTKADSQGHIEKLIQLFHLEHCQNDVIGERTIRGVVGGQLKRLELAGECVGLPKMIFVEEAVTGLDLPMAEDLIGNLEGLSELEHTVIVTMDQPPAAVAARIHTCVLLTEGRVIYSGAVSNIVAHFTDALLGYKKMEGVSATDFALDIAMGYEKPVHNRKALTSEQLADKFSSSQFYFAPLKTNTSVQLSEVQYTANYKHNSQNSFWVMYTLLRRHWLIKLREFGTVFRRTAALSFFCTLCGLVFLNLTRVNTYLLNIQMRPYPEVNACQAALFFTTAISFGHPLVNLGYFANSHHLFRDEQQRGSNKSILYFVVTIVTELPFLVINQSVVFNILYSMCNFGWDLDKYCYYFQICFLESVIGLLVILSLTSLCKTEKRSRDVFSFLALNEAMLSGFLLTLGNLPWIFQAISKLGSLRWTLQGLMVHTYQNHWDGEVFLGLYDFDHTSDRLPLMMLLCLTVAYLGIFLFTLLPHTNRLKFTHPLLALNDLDQLSRDTHGFTFRTSSLGFQEPPVMTRVPSISSDSSISSTDLVEGLDRTSLLTRGQVISFKSVMYMFLPSFCTNYPRIKTVINNAYGRFEPGQLSVVMGATGSGKSSLLAILAGEPLRGIFSGTISFDDQVADTIPAWKRCAYVAADAAIIQSLSVRQLLSYALKLRATGTGPLQLPEPGFSLKINTMLDIFSLRAVSRKSVASLPPGTKRRVAMAEALVSTPRNVILDEPITGLDTSDAVHLMNGLRELVNQQRTVVCSMHQPSQTCFQLFDSLLLLCEGRVVYAGPANTAVDYFVKSPFEFTLGDAYINPADFVVTAATRYILCSDGERPTPDQLENTFKSSEHFLSSPWFYRPTKCASVSTDMRTPMLADKEILSTRNCRRYPLSTGKQIYILLHRECVSLLSDRQLMLTSFLLNVVFALYIGCLWWSTGEDFHNLLAYNMFSSLACLGLTCQFVSHMAQSLLTFRYESNRGLYSTAVFCFVVTLPVIITRLFLAGIFLTISYFMADFPADRFGFTLYLTLLGCVAGVLLLYLLLTLTGNIERSYGTFVTLLFLSAAFSGQEVTFDQMAWYLRPLTYVSLVRWLTQGLLINQTKDSSLLTGSDDPDTQAMAYSALLENFSFEDQSKWECSYIVIGYTGVLLLGLLVVMQFRDWRASVSYTSAPNVGSVTSAA